MSKIVDLIKSRGYWDVEIRPQTFLERRVPKKTQLIGILRSSAVQLRGWDFPHIAHGQDPAIEQDRIEQEHRWNHYVESFRFYQSGLFVDLAGFPEDWRDNSGLWPPENSGWTWGRDFHIENAVYRLTEVLEFASRLSETPAGDEVMEVQVKCVGLKGRALQVGPNRMPFFPPHTAQGNVFSYVAQLSKPQLTQARDVALDAAGQLFDQFGWDAQTDVLRDVQRQLRR